VAQFIDIYGQQDGKVLLHYGIERRLAICGPPLLVNYKELDSSHCSAARNCDQTISPSIDANNRTLALQRFLDDKYLPKIIQ
jgi:hypothetical protein